MEHPSDLPSQANEPEPDACLAATRRFPRYVRFLHDAQAVEQEYLSVERLAAALNIEPAQVHQDLAITGVNARPGVGFNSAELINAIEQYLGWNNTTDALLVGAGHLGAALAGYAGFQRYGLNIVAVFDVDDRKVGRKVSGKLVHHFDQIVSIAQKTHAHMGIIAVPGLVAQKIADVLVLTGIRAIWNFAPVRLNVPDNVVVETTDLAASLAVLSRKLADAVRPDR
jgi:redox-sensing transcriptional repressor